MQQVGTHSDRATPGATATSSTTTQDRTSRSTKCQTQSAEHPATNTQQHTTRAHSTGPLETLRETRQPPTPSRRPKPEYSSRPDPPAPPRHPARRAYAAATAQTDHEGNTHAAHEADTPAAPPPPPIRGQRTTLKRQRLLFPPIPVPEINRLPLFPHSSPTHSTNTGDTPPSHPQTQHLLCYPTPRPSTAPPTSMNTISPPTSDPPLHNYPSIFEDATISQ